jgi:hypothetical protein
MVDPQPVDDALGDQPQRERVRGLENLGVLHAHAGQLVDVEEAAPPGWVGPGRIQVEELLAQRRVGPVPVGRVGRHVVRDDVEDQAEAVLVRGGGERAQALLPAQRIADPARVDHVVAVRRSLPRLERRREVDVRNAELRQVGHERAHRGEVEVGAELEAVGRAELARAHATLRSTVIERAVT